MGLKTPNIDFPAVVVSKNIKAGFDSFSLIYVILKPAFLQFLRQAKGIVYLIDIHK